MVVIHLEGKKNIFAPCQRMATAIADVMRTKEECFPSDLDESFSDNELQKHWSLAYALACVDLMGEERYV